MSMNLKTAGQGKLKGLEAGMASFISLETLNDIWNLNHCYARIRIISAYCLFLLKRAKYYKAEVNRVTTAEFVHEQFCEMVKYKSQILEIEEWAIEEANLAKSQLKEEIKRLSGSLKAELDRKFCLVAEKVGEKIPGETAANKLEMDEESVEGLLAEEYELLRRW